MSIPNCWPRSWPRRSSANEKSYPPRAAKYDEGPPGGTDLHQWSAPPRNGVSTSMHRMHRMHRIFSENGWLAILTIGRPAPDHRLSRLLVHQSGTVVGKGRAPRERGRPARMLFLPMLPPTPSGLHPRAGAVAAYAARLLCAPVPWAHAAVPKGTLAFVAERGGPEAPPASPARRPAVAALAADWNPGLPPGRGSIRVLDWSAQPGGARSIHRPSALDSSQAPISRCASRPSEIWGR